MCPVLNVVSSAAVIMLLDKRWLSVNGVEEKHLSPGGCVPQQELCLASIKLCVPDANLLRIGSSDCGIGGLGAVAGCTKETETGA